MSIQRLSVDAFGLRDYVKKGAKLYVEGKLQTQSWEKDGVKHYRTEILINELVLMSDKEEGGSYRNSYAASESYSPPKTVPVTDLDIPF